MQRSGGMNASLEQFKREARAAAAAIPLEWRDRAIRLATFAIEQLNERSEDTSSVDTGAYRAEHTIEQEGRIVFEHPQRVGPDTPLPSQKRLGNPPLIDAADSSEVAAQLESNLALGNFSFVNRRFYAGSLEHGSANIEPRLIYASAAAIVAHYAEVLAAEGPRRPELRRAA
jgi:hypothetical protein